MLLRHLKSLCGDLKVFSKCLPKGVTLVEKITEGKHHTLQLGPGFRKAFFSSRVLQHCMGLPREAVKSLSMEIVKKWVVKATFDLVYQQ